MQMFINILNFLRFYNFIKFTSISLTDSWLLSIFKTAIEASDLIGRLELPGLINNTSSIIFR